MRFYRLSNNLFELAQRVKLYVKWTLIYSPLAIWHYIYMKMKCIQIIKSFIYGFFLFGENYNSFILWYLLSSVYSLLFIYLLRKINCSYKKIFAIGSFLCLFLIILTSYKNQNLILNNCFIDGFINKIIKIERIFTGFIFIPMGFFIRKINFNTNKNIYLVLFGLGFIMDILFINREFWYEIGKLIAIFGLVLYVVKTPFFNEIDCIKCRKFSKFLYFWHMWIYTIISFLLYGIGIMKKGMLLYLLVLFISIVLFLLHDICKRKLISK